ncbi:MAG: ligand-gated channel [Bacteroidales bacterium 36-12]|nr:MAG: ligand-gated channel [Bacteroidales bacterium 36-12]
MFLFDFNSVSVRIFFLLKVFLISSTIIFADGRLDTTKVYHIEEVIVTEQYRNTETRSSSPLQILSSSQIEKLNVLHVSDAVKYFSGVIVKDYGGIGGLKTVSVRSLGAAHTAVSYDGIAITDCQTGQIDIGRFSLDNVDVLSLHNGQSDNIFQPARLFASASLLNIRTLSPKFAEGKTYNGKVSIKTGSFGLINPSLLYQQKINKTLSSTLSAEWLSAHGEYPYVLQHSYLGDGITSLEKRKNSDVKNLRIETALHAAFSENESANLKLYFYNSERGLPGGTILYNEGAFTSQRMWDNTFFVQSHYEKDFSQKFAMQINAKYHHGFLHYLDTVVWNSYGYEESYFTQNEYYLSASALYRAFDKLSFSLSTDASVNNMFARFENEALTNEFAKPLRYSQLSVLAAKYVDNNVLATASLLSTVVVEKVAVGNAAPNQNRLSPYVSITHKPFTEIDLRWRAFYKNIFRLPTFNDLYYARIGNANLRPENTDQFNIGMTYSSDFKGNIPQISITADVYRNNVKDKIVAMPTKNLFKWTMLNLGKVEITGIDLTAETHMKINRDIAIVAGGTYTYQRAVDVTDKQSSTYGHQIPYTPRVSGSGRFAVETSWFDIAYSVLWSGKRYSLFQNYAENRLSGYSDHSVSASKDFSFKDKLISLNLEVLNILNENYAIVKWFPMPGRSVRGTINIKF